MGLRVEQHNIEDLLKYFIARNEFGRRNILEILKGLNDEELLKLNISNEAEFYNFYKFLYKALKQSIVEGTKTALKDSNELIGKCWYSKDFLMKYPFQYILELRLIEKLTKSYSFIYDSIEDGSWQTLDTGKVVDLNDYGITIEGTPKNDDTIKVDYIAFNGYNHETATIFIEKGENLSKPIVNVKFFGDKVRKDSPFNYTSENTVDELFQKIVESNPEITSIYEKPMLVSPDYSIYNNSDDKYKLDDLLTFDSDIYYMSDIDQQGLSEMTKTAIILAALRKILDERNIKYTETDYLTKTTIPDLNGVIETYNLNIEKMLQLVLDTNPIIEDELNGEKEETFRTLQSEIYSLKAYVNEYMNNETMYSGSNYFTKKGKANYSGYNLFTTIPHNTGLMPCTVIINNVVSETIGDTGNVYVKSDLQNIYVYNTGKNRSEFDFTIIFDDGSYIEFPKDITFDDFVKTSINSISKTRLDDSLVYEEDGYIRIKLLNEDGESLFNKYEFLIITDDETKKESLYRIGDTELFAYDEVTNTLFIISDKVNADLNDSYHLTAMGIDSDTPIMYLLTELMLNPDYYIHYAMNFAERMYSLDPNNEDDNKEYTEYAKVLGFETVEGLKRNYEKIRYIDLSSYFISENDILFINGLSYSLLDDDHFRVFFITDEEGIKKKVLIIHNFEIDKIDEIYLSRLSSSINSLDPEDSEGSDPDTNDSNIYDFDKFVYLNSNSSFGHHYFKSHVIPEEEIITEDEYEFDSSSRMFNEHPLTNRIEGFNNHYEHHNCEYDDSEITYDKDHMYVDCYNGKHGYITKTKHQRRYAIVSHKLNKVPNFINIIPFTNNIDKEEGKNVGNIWWTADDKNIYVYNDGNSTCEFSWFAAYDENCKVEICNYKKSVSLDKENCLFYNLSHNKKPDYYGIDYIKHDGYNQITVYNTNNDNMESTYNLSYIVDKHVTNKKFLEYAKEFEYDQNGYFDRNSEIQPTGDKVLNYSGEFRTTKARVYGDGIVQYLSVDDSNIFNVGDIVSYVDGECVLANGNNAKNIIGVVADNNFALAIDSYSDSKIPVALHGIHDVKVIGEISAGQKLYLDITKNGIATSSNIIETYHIGKALEDYNNVNDTGIIKALLNIM